MFTDKLLCGRWPSLVTLVIAGVLVGCGGGGGGDASTGAPLPALAEDVLPSGPRIDLVALDYFASLPGNTWTYANTDSVAGPGSAVTRTAAAGAGGDVVITESGHGESFTETWRRTSDGVLLLQPLGNFGLGVGPEVAPSILLYPEPFYPLGAERRVIRQGSLGGDLDGDGIDDSFRLEFSQVLIAFETIDLPSGRLTDVAHFRDMLRLTVQPSNRTIESVTIIGTEHSWWAPGIGLVRADRSVTDADGLPLGGVQTLLLTGGTVGGKELFLPEPDGMLTAVTLAHRGLVYDAVRQRYYASVAGSVPVNGNSIATIDPWTGAITYSAPVGAEPAALALSADGNVLHVGLDGSGEVLRLRVPDMQEFGRTRLPALAFSGQLLAESLAVSPTDASVVAVAMRRVGTSPRHAGVALIRGDVLQPSITQDHTGSNLLVFDNGGDSVYGFNTESTERGLRRLEVLADGLREVFVVQATDYLFGSATLDRSPQGLLLGRELRRTTDLSVVGRYAADGAQCHWHGAKSRVVCLGVMGSGVDRFLTVADPHTFVVEATPVFQPGYGQQEIAQLVPGPIGQVAMRIGSGWVGGVATAIWLFATPALD